MFRLFLVLLAVLAATPAFATDQYQNVERVIVEYEPVQKVQKVQKQQKVIIREKVIVQDVDPYAAYAAAVHAQNQAQIERFLNAAAKQAAKDQQRFRRQRSRVVNRGGSSLNVQVNRGRGFGFF